MTKEEIIKTYSNITSIKELEEKKGNALDKAILKIKYKENMTIKENINIFSIVKNSSLYEYIKYFKQFKIKFGEQNNDTKLNINDYINEINHISQKIEIIFVFNIENKIEEINERSDIIMEAITITSLGDKIWKCF